MMAQKAALLCAVMGVLSQVPEVWCCSLVQMLRTTHTRWNPGPLVVGSEVGGIVHFMENGKIPITVNGYSACAQLGQPLPSQGTHPGGAWGCEHGSVASFQDVVKDSICSMNALRHI